MSNLLNEAIVDAKALREAALKNAETVVIEKYSEEVRETLNKLLEQEEDAALDAALGGDVADDAAAPTLDAEPVAEGEEEEGNGITEEEIPLSATDDLSEFEGDNLSSFSGGGESVELELNLGALQEAVAALADELNEDEEYEINEEQLEEILSEDEDLDEAAKPDFLDLDKDGDKEESMKDAAADAKGDDKDDDDEKEDDDDDDKDLSKVPPQLRKHVAKKKANEGLNHEDLISAIMEKLTVDMGADLAGWAGRRQEDKKYQIEKEMARRVSTDVAEELQDLKKAHEELVFENKQLAEQNNEYNNVLQGLKENLHDVNLSNARLLYTNRVLRNTSLNERQKEKIVEAISGAGSVTEAKTIFETLQSTVEAAPKKSPKSLSEAIGRRSTVLRATRQETPSSDPLQERMKRLAGIK